MSQKLQRFKKKTLEDFHPFAVFLDTIHRSGEAFVVALRIDRDGWKCVLAFQEGATEKHETCEALLSELERRAFS